jgi:hypothetical protein
MPAVGDPVGGTLRPDPRRIEVTILSVSLKEIRSSDMTPTVSFDIGVVTREKRASSNPGAIDGTLSVQTGSARHSIRMFAASITRAMQETSNRSTGPDCPLL